MRTVAKLALIISALTVVGCKPIETTETTGRNLVTIPFIGDAFVGDFNPLNNTQWRISQGTVYEPLWVINTLVGDINWRLAESYQYANDFRSIRITLKSNLTWSDGETIDADDLLYTLELGRNDVKLDTTGLWSDGTLSRIEKIDQLSVNVHFSTTTAAADWALANLMIVPQHIFVQAADPYNFTNNQAVGSGPFTEAVNLSNDTIRLCKNPYYYKASQGIPKLACVQFQRFNGNQEVYSALLDNEIDFASNFIADVDRTYVAQDPKNHGYWYPANDVWNMYLNTRTAPFSNIEFRKAFSMAIDRSEMVELAASGYPTPVETIVGIDKFHQVHFNETINNTYADLASYNVNAASTLLDNAGYLDIDDDGWRENPDGSDINFTIKIPAGWVDVVKMVEMTTEYLAAIGIQARTQLTDWTGYDTALKTGDYDVVFNWSATNDVDPIMAYREYYHPSRVGVSWHANHGMASDALGSLVDEYIAKDDTTRRKEILDELMIFTAENLPFIAVMSNATWYQYNTTHVTGFPTEQDPYVHPSLNVPANQLLVLERLQAK